MRDFTIPRADSVKHTLTDAEMFIKPTFFFF